MICSLLAFSVLNPQKIDRVLLEGNPIFGELAKEWIAMMPDFGVTGFAVVAVQEGKVVLLDAYGDADPFANKKADIDTRYYIASITKTMTATAIAQLAEQGKINLDAPVQKYLPRFDLADKEYAKTITVRDLLCHRPGITGGKVVLLDAYTGAINDDRFYRMVGESTPTKKVEYTNVHFTILGRVIESVTGMKWQDYLAANVFGPIGMNRSTAYVSKIGNDANFAPPLVIGPGGVLQPSPHMKTDRTMHAAGGVITTPRDMTRFLMAFINGGEAAGTRLLNEQTVNDALTHQSRFPVDGRIRQFDGYGYGWQLGKYRDHAGLAAHGGGYTGYFAFIAMIPEKKMAMAVMVNNGGSGAPFGTLLMVDVFDKLLAYPVDTALRDNYKKQVGAYFERVKQRRPLGPNPALSGLLTLTPEEYCGRYENDLYGSATIQYSGGYLTMSFDDLPQTIKSTALDEFTAHNDVFDSGTPCKFVVRDKACAAIEVNLSGTKVLFEKK